MKGFKKNGKFIPTGNKSKSALKKSDIRKKETVGIPMSQSEVEKAMQEHREEQMKIKEDELGLTDKQIQYSFGFPSGGLGTQQDREIGNELIHRIVEDEKSKHPEFKNWKIDNSVYNEYNTIQHVLASSEDEVNKLLEWRNDGNPKTWKWTEPIIGNFDSDNTGWETEAYKSKVVITLMSPTDYLELVSPRTLTHGRNDIRGEEHTKESIDRLTQRMTDGKVIGTPFMIVDDDKKIFNHEGQHRALSAIKSGIELMPVYVYMNGGEFTDDDYKSIPKNPLDNIKPNLRSLGD